jgi:hypothetical protein
MGGARLLTRQDPEGTWAGSLSSDGGLYSPKWTSTTYTMLMLRDFGLLPSTRQTGKACTLRRVMTAMPKPQPRLFQRPGKKPDIPERSGPEPAT